MNNTDLFEKPFYTVHVNGLFGLTTKASVTKKFTDQLITGESSFRAGIDPINEDSEPIVTRVTGDSIVERMRPMQDEYNRNMLAVTISSVEESRRRLVLNTLQRQLQTGQIDHITYLDLISQQE